MGVSYDIIRSKRKTIAIQVMADGNILVRSPIEMDNRTVKAFVESKMSWIEKQLSQCNQMLEPPFSKAEIEKLRRQTRILIEDRAAYYAPLVGVSYNRITIRVQHSRWGSCSSKGNLNFNCLLALVPIEVLDYVVVHELCHLKEMNHSRRFWAEAGKILPNYAEYRRWLVEHGRTLIGRIPY